VLCQILFSAIFAAGIVGGWLALRRRRRANETYGTALNFEERATSEFELLKLV
jgi:hypothetical protein